MKLVENYLSQVDDYLTSNTDEDVLQELESAIYDAIDEQEEIQGNKLQDSDIASILRKFGSPMEVAAKYAPQQYLIGPSLFPTFRYGLKVVFMLVLVLQCVKMLLGFVVSEDASFNIFELTSRILYSGFWGFGWLVIIFASFEYYGAKLPGASTWDPLKVSTTRQSSNDRNDAITNVISDVFMLLIWNNWIAPAINGTHSMGPLSVTFSDMFIALYWPVNALLVASVALYSWLLLNNSWNKKEVGFALVLDVLSLTVIILLLQSADQMVFAVNNDIDHGFAERAASHASMVFKVSMAVIFAFVAWDGWKHWKLWQKLTN